MLVQLLESFATLIRSATLIALLISASPIHAQSAAPATAASTVLGVFDEASGAPVEGVQVRDVATGAFAMTTATGTVSLNFLGFHSDTAVVELRKIGFRPLSFTVRRDEKAITKTLDRITELEATVIAEHYRIDTDAGVRDGIGARCGAKHASCFSVDDISKYPARSLVEVIAHADGIVGGLHMRRSTGFGLCIPRIYVNGIVDKDGAVLFSNQSPFTNTDIATIEIYRADQPRPLRFSGDPTCGAIVVWTKQ